MTTTNTIASRLKPLIFITGITLGLVALCAIVLTLTWTALVTSQDNSVFAKSQSASQHDSLMGSIDVQDVTSSRSGEDAGVAVSETNEIAIWFTRLAIGLSSDSAVSYVTYVQTLSPQDQVVTVPGSPTSK